MPNDISWGTIVLNLTSYVAGAFSAVVTTLFLGTFFGPKLRISFLQNEPGFVFDPGQNYASSSAPRLMGATGPSGPSDDGSIYVRIRVCNLGNRMAKNCRAYLTGYKRLNESGRTVATGYVDSIPLCWSYRSKDDPHGIDIPNGPLFHCDVFSTYSLSNSMHPELVKVPKYCANLFTEPGTYVYEITLTADDVKPQTFRLKVDWRGKWNDFGATEVK